MSELSSKPSKVICGLAVWWDDTCQEWTWETANCEWYWPPLRVRYVDGAIRQLRTGATSLRGAVRRSLREDEYPGSLYPYAGG